MNNHRVEYQQIERGIVEQSNIACTGKHILCLQDTSEFNYGAQNNNVKPNELGLVGNNVNIGFFAHPTILVDAEDDAYFPLGYSSLGLWTRPINKDNKRFDYKKKPFEERESFKWIKGIESVYKITNAKSKTIIGDREFDIYQSYLKAKDDTNIIARCRVNRNLVNKKDKMYEYLNKQPVQTTIELDVKANKKSGRSKHKAKLNIKFIEVEIARPYNLSKSLPAGVKLYLVEAKECKTTVKENEPPVEWRILTTHKVETVAKALKIIEWYTVRWQVEELFATMKSRAFELEKSQLETKGALFKLASLTFVAALKILQLAKGRDKENQNAKIIFTKKHIALITVLIKKYEGNTKAQQNKYKKESLAWAAWLIGRMGGWSGYQSDSPPGIKTMKRGFEKFENMFELQQLLE